MESKKLIMEQLERVREYLAKQQIGTDEYNKAMKNLLNLEDKLIEIEKNESEAATKDAQTKIDKKDRIVKNVTEIGKFIIGGVIIPAVGLVCITATEKDTTFTGTLKEYTRLFIPKKMI